MVVCMSLHYCIKVVIVYLQFVIITAGCTIDSLLDTDRNPECSKREGDMCTCTVMSSDGRYGIMYDGTSVGSTAHLFTNNSYCYNRPQILVRTCQDNGNWSGETVNTTDIVTGIIIHTHAYIHTYMLFVFIIFS